MGKTVSHSSKFTFRLIHFSVLLSDLDFAFAPPKRKRAFTSAGVILIGVQEFSLVWLGDATLFLDWGTLHMELGFGPSNMTLCLCEMDSC